MLFFTSLDGMSHIFNHPAISNMSIKAQDSTIVIKVKAGSNVVYVNGEAKTIDTSPEIFQSRMFVPVRFIVDILGGETNWYKATNQVTVKTNDTTIIFWIGKPTAIVNGVSKPIDPNNQQIVPYLKESRAMLPLRFIGESAGCLINYNSQTSEAILISNLGIKNNISSKVEVNVLGKKYYIVHLNRILGDQELISKYNRPDPTIYTDENYIPIGDIKLLKEIDVINWARIFSASEPIRDINLCLNIIDTRSKDHKKLVFYDTMLNVLSRSSAAALHLFVTQGVDLGPVTLGIGKDILLKFASDPNFYFSLFVYKSFEDAKTEFNEVLKILSENAEIKDYETAVSYLKHRSKAHISYDPALKLLNDIDLSGGYGAMDEITKYLKSFGDTLLEAQTTFSQVTGIDINSIQTVEQYNNVFQNYSQKLYMVYKYLDAAQQDMDILTKIFPLNDYLAALKDQKNMAEPLDINGSNYQLSAYARYTYDLVKYYLSDTSSPPWNENQQDFTISINPTSRTINQGDQTTYSVCVSPLGGFNSPVSLSISNLPSNLTYSFDQNSIVPQKTSILTITTSLLTPTGTYNLTINAISGGIVKAENIELKILTQTTLGQVQLSSPGNGSTLPPGNITFSWNSVSNATKYEIIIYNHLGQVALDGPAYGTSVSVALGTEETITWKVRAGDNSGNWGAWSSIWSLTIKKP